MLETFALQLSQGILTRIVAALKRFGGHSDDSDDTTPQTPSSERRGGGQNVQA